MIVMNHREISEIIKNSLQQDTCMELHVDLPLHVGITDLFN